MKFNRVVFFLLVATLSALLSACSGARVASNWPGIASDGKTVYLADGSYVYSVQLSDGKDVSTATADGQVPLRFPLKADANLSFYAAPELTSAGQMILGNAAANNHMLYGIDPATSNIKWTFEEASGLWLANVLVSDNTIYAPSGNGILYALDLSGKKIWQANLSQHSLWSAPVTDGKYIYVATIDHVIFALDAKTGAQVWKKELDNAILGAPAITADGSLYVGTLSGNLYGLSATDGMQKWLVSLSGSIWSAPAVDGETLYIGTTAENKTGKFYAINTSNGQITWSRDEDTAVIASPLVLPDQVVYVTEGGRVQSISKDNTVKWDKSIDKAKILTAPYLVGDTILVAPMQVETLLVAYNLSGAQKWTYIPGK
jgi:outer membrane protein assembly factor BamB